MPAFIDLTGLTFGSLTVVGVAGRCGHNIRWKCICTCGSERSMVKMELNRQAVYMSCTCWRRKEHHGEGGRNKRYTVEYKTWERMKRRCYYKSDEYYHRYGGRGITVCERWMNSYQAFLSDMGRRPSPDHTLERIDNDSGYSPENCRWATQVEQQRNKSTNRMIEVGGETLCVTDWAKKLGVVPVTIFGRLRRGWNPQRAVTEPVSHRSK